MTLNEITVLLLIMTVFTLYMYHWARPQRDFSGLDYEMAVRWTVRIVFLVFSFILIGTNIIINLQRLHD